VLERARALDTVVFDKTGTLTAGKPTVRRAVVVEGQTERRVVEYAAAVERNSRHPLALAVVEAAKRLEQRGEEEEEESGAFAAKKKRLKKKPASAARREGRAVADDETFRQEPGAGAVATVDGVTVAVGTWAFVTSTSPGGSPIDAASASRGARMPDALATHAASVPAGRTPVYVSFDGACVGALEMEDAIRPEAKSTVDRLHARGIRTVLLSGDRTATAVEVGTALGIAREDIFGDVRPEEKAARVDAMRASGRKVAMVGDGINDAAALAAADVGVAMGGGVGAASDAASIVLLGDNPTQVVDAVELSRATFAKIKQNLGWAFAYNLVGIPIAAGALLPVTGLALTPSVAGGLMGFSSLGVMGNSLTLRLAGRKLSKPPTPREEGVDADAGGGTRRSDESA
jgi:Cu2+-exporting ATPase